MKRTIIAITIACILIAVCLIERGSVNGFCDRLEKQINECAALYEESPEKCVKKCENLRDLSEEKLAGATLFINHGFTDDISAILATLPVYARAKSDENFYAGCEAIKQIIKQIRRDQRITADSFY